MCNGKPWSECVKLTGDSVATLEITGNLPDEILAFVSNIDVTWGVEHKGETFRAVCTRFEVNKETGEYEATLKIVRGCE